MAPKQSNPQESYSSERSKRWVKIITENVSVDLPQVPHPAELWRALPELPTGGEISAPETETALENIVDRSWPSKTDFLTAQYSLLRLDAVEPLRFSVNQFKESPTMQDD